MASEAVAKQGFDDAPVAVPPPSPSTTPFGLRLSRPEPSVTDLEKRLSGMLAVMGLEIETDQATVWAQEVHPGEDPPHEDSGSSTTEVIPGVVVTYDPWLDDLAVVHGALLEEGEGQQLDDVPWTVVGDVMDALVDRDLVDRSFDDFTVSFVRSGIKGPNGDHLQWVDEVRFEANAMFDGIPILDAGLRIGITPAHEISSLRITRIVQEQLDPVTIGASEASIRDSFAAHVAESTSASIVSVEVAERRPVYLLSPSISSAIIEPQYLIRYSLVSNDENAQVTSRATMLLMSLTTPQPLVELRLP